MITCRRHHLEQRCRERGYTLDEVMACVVEQDGDKWLIDVDHPAYPRPKSAPAISTLQKVKNFAAAAVQHVAAGAPRATDEEVARRFSICQGCEFYDGKACMKCGCPIVREGKFISKLAWADQKCPVGKW